MAESVKAGGGTEVDFSSGIFASLIYTGIDGMNEAIVKTIPPPTGDQEAVLQAQVTNLDYSDFLGRIAIARVFQGPLRRNETIAIAKRDGSLQTTKLTKLTKETLPLGVLRVLGGEPS